MLLTGIKMNGNGDGLLILLLTRSLPSSDLVTENGVVAVDFEDMLVDNVLVVRIRNT
jgi:hypothetical protein